MSLGFVLIFTAAKKFSFLVLAPGQKRKTVNDHDGNEM